MAIFSFFKKPLHQKFDYKPRFYDAEKEERKARLARYQEGNGGEDAMKSRISAGFKRKSRSGGAGYSSKKRNLRLVAILVVLVWMTYHFLEKYLPIIVDAVE